jgi:hypothetical protein
MNKITGSFLIVFLMLLVQVPAHAQSTQYKESDLDFVTRMNKQASEMYNGANELDVRIKSVDSKSDGKKKRKKLRNKLKEFKAQIRDEQARMDGKEFKKGKKKKNQEKRMRKLDERLRQLAAAFAAI